MEEKKSVLHHNIISLAFVNHMYIRAIYHSYYVCPCSARVAYAALNLLAWLWLLLMLSCLKATLCSWNHMKWKRKWRNACNEFADKYEMWALHITCAGQWTANIAQHQHSWRLMGCSVAIHILAGSCAALGHLDRSTRLNAWTQLVSDRPIDYVQRWHILVTR